MRSSAFMRHAEIVPPCVVCKAGYADGSGIIRELGLTVAMDAHGVSLYEPIRARAGAKHD